MRRILDRDNLDILAQLAWSRVLLGFDFDGTLAPIVADRDAAVMRSETAALFAEVCSLYPCAVISGRSRADVAERVGAAQVKYFVGNHGMEPQGASAGGRPEIAAAAELLGRALAEHAGVDIEDKQYSLAIHYRRSRRTREARAAITCAIAALPTPMRTVAGKMVVNVVPAHAPHKGDALLELREREGASTALYVGDDVTDEDVFAIDQPGRLVSVRIGESKASAAKYFVRNQREIDALLTKLALHRREQRRG
jgi:trehalose 6-phosphate phosphatase